MLVLGILLILLSAGALLAVLGSGTDEQAGLYSGTVELPTLVMFLAGAATLLIFIMGLELLRAQARAAGERAPGAGWRSDRRLAAHDQQRAARDTAAARLLTLHAVTDVLIGWPTRPAQGCRPDRRARPR
jgi:hypothetical protein